MQSFSLLRSKLSSSNIFRKIVSNVVAFLGKLNFTGRKSQILNLILEDCLKSVPENSRCLTLKVRSTSHKEFLFIEMFSRVFQELSVKWQIVIVENMAVQFWVISDLTRFFSLFTRNKLLSELTLKYAKLIKKCHNYRVWYFLSSSCSCAVSWCCFVLEIRS